MSRIGFMAVAGLGLVLSAMPVSAQGRGNGKGPAAAAKHAGGGPKFCQTGEGHPVYGLAWCMDKGYGLGGGDWRRVEMSGFALKGKHRTDERVDRGGLIGVLGDVIFGQIDSHRIEVGVSVDLSGRWLVPDDGAAVLQIFAGDRAVGEVVDANRDGKADAVVLNFRF